MRLCIVGRDDDALAQVVARRAELRGHGVGWLPFHRMLSGARAGWMEGQFRWEGVDLASFEAFFVRQLPSPHALLGPPESERSAASWYRLGKEQVERWTFAMSALGALERAGSRMMNPPLASGPFEHKPLQLAAFQAAGLVIPETVITNDPEEARAFRASARGRGVEVIIKPTAGGAPAAILDEEKLAAWAAVRPSPVIVQERIPGPDIRVTVVDGDIVSAVRIDSEAVDYRMDPAFRGGERVYRVHGLPPAAQAMCLRAASLCRHLLSGLDLRFDEARGLHVLLEANAAPEVLDIEEETGAPIVDAIVDALVRSDAPALSPANTGPVQG